MTYCIKIKMNSQQQCNTVEHEREMLDLYLYAELHPQPSLYKETLSTLSFAFTVQHKSQINLFLIKSATANISVCHLTEASNICMMARGGQTEFIIHAQV